MTNVGDRIQIVADQLGSVPKLAAEAGIKATTIYGWIKGPGEPRASDIEAIAKATGANIDWLVTGNGEGGELPADSARYVSLPRYAVQASAGGGALVLSEEVNGTFTVGRDWLARYVPPGSKTGIIEARGDSMEPTIFDGDILLLNFSIDRSAVDGGGVFVITVDGSLLVKRLQVTLDGHVLVLSDNDNYETEKVTREYADERMIVHAQVVWSGGPIRGR